MVLTYPVALAAYARIIKFSFVPLFEEFRFPFIEMRFLRRVREKEAKINSTLLEASIYYSYADYNPHYECKRDKAHSQ